MESRILVLLLNPFTHDSRVLKECRSLARAGYRLQLLALHEKGLPVQETISGFSVLRLKIIFRSLLPKAKPLWFLETLFRMVFFRPRQFDIVHCHDLTGLLPGVLIKILSFLMLKKVYVVYDAHEYQTEVNAISTFRRLVARLVERFCMLFVDRFITVSEAFVEEYKKLYGIGGGYAVLNAPPAAVLDGTQNHFREKYKIPESSRVFLYQGGFTLNRGIERSLEAFSKLDDTNCIVFMGYGPLEALVKKYAQEYSNIFYHQAVPPKELVHYTRSADAGLLLYENTCLNHYFCSPNKLFEYLMSGLPIVASDLFELSRLIHLEKVGIVAPDGEVQSLVELINTLQDKDLAEWSKNALNARMKYAWEEQEKVLLKAYEF